jgi:hypothetical protein
MYGLEHMRLLIHDDDRQHAPTADVHRGGHHTFNGGALAQSSPVSVVHQDHWRVRSLLTTFSLWTGVWTKTLFGQIRKRLQRSMADHLSAQPR